MEALKKLVRKLLPYASGDIGGSYWSKDAPIYPGGFRLVPLDLIDELVVIAECCICQCSDDHCDGKCSKCINYRGTVEKTKQLLNEPSQQGEGV